MTDAHTTAATTEENDFLVDPRGNRILRKNIKEIDLLRHETVLGLLEEGLEAARTVAAFKQKAYQEILAFADISLEKYGVKRGGKKGNISLLTFDGMYKIELSRQDHLQFTEQLQAARQLILECFDEWTDGARSEVKTLINEAFSTNKAGEVSSNKVLRLLRLEIEGPKWETAMQAIRDSITIAGSSAYIRLYQRVGESEKYQQIPLDGSAALDVLQESRA